MKCRKCGGSAALELRRHNTAFCSPHFVEFFKKQVAEAIHKHRMFTRDEPVLVAVSGGKDSLALWDVLIEDGYRTAGLYLDLGIFDYSQESRARCEAFASARGLRAAGGCPAQGVQRLRSGDDRRDLRLLQARRPGEAPYGAVERRTRHGRMNHRSVI